jgi:hypothetical protein
MPAFGRSLYQKDFTSVFAGDPSFAGVRFFQEEPRNRSFFTPTVPRPPSDHLFHHGVEARVVLPVLPAELPMRLGWVTDQEVHLGRTEVAGVDLISTWPD